MKVLVIDIGGTNIKMLAAGYTEPRKFPSGKAMTPDQIVSQIKVLAKDWKYDAVSIGYPGFIKNGKIITEPHNLGRGWIGFDFEAAFGRPVRILNDAAMQALGSYKSGTLLFLGLGTGLGSTFIVDGTVIPFEVAHLAYRKGTHEDYIGKRGLEKYGKKRWQEHVSTIVERFCKALCPDDVVLGGGNSKNLEELPPLCRLGDNKFAFTGGFRMWEEPKKSYK